VRGGTGGNNFLFAGTGPTTLFGGGSGDQLFATGNAGQQLHAGSGNETLSGAFSSGADTYYGGSGSTQILGGSGNDTFVAGSGLATITAGLGNDLFVFFNGQAGGTDLVNNFISGQDTIDLQGYGPNEVNNAVKNQQMSGGSTTITLSDNTRVTFTGVSALTTKDFTTS
jgi:Ca2+-binding RTX toxin-like protein